MEDLMISHALLNDRSRFQEMLSHGDFTTTKHYIVLTETKMTIMSLGNTSLGDYYHIDTALLTET
jgi:hypothetical protein